MHFDIYRTLNVPCNFRSVLVFTSKMRIKHWWYTNCVEIACRYIEDRKVNMHNLLHICTKIALLDKIILRHAWQWAKTQQKVKKSWKIRRKAMVKGRRGWKYEEKPSKKPRTIWEYEEKPWWKGGQVKHTKRNPTKSQEKLENIEKNHAWRKNRVWTYGYVSKYRVQPGKFD